MPSRERLLGWLVLISISNDTGAYLLGSWRGRIPLAPSLSPSKTLEGAVGGLLCAVVIGVLCGGILPMNLHPILLAFIALLIGFAGQVGDLLESYFKRIHGIKDFGSALGSHGGIFDRVDSHFASAIVFLILINCFK
ncbi:MAG: phosphatidate cytidylyltransferase, partial [SAR324 cluster bacterium]|nr:phosphatidate cytidylyltransferase [SAR324 cluster bacterium]